jgi:hypothetical protein
MLWPPAPAPHRRQVALLEVDAGPGSPRWLFGEHGPKGRFYGELLILAEARWLQRTRPLHGDRRRFPRTRRDGERRPLTRPTPPPEPRYSARVSNDQNRPICARRSHDARLRELLNIRSVSVWALMALPNTYIPQRTGSCISWPPPARTDRAVSPCNARLRPAGPRRRSQRAWRPGRDDFSESRPSLPGTPPGDQLADECGDPVPRGASYARP